MLSNAKPGAFGPGDRVNWTLRPSGGYGFPIRVAAVVREVRGQRATIVVARRVRGEWVRDTVCVRVKNLAQRAGYVHEVDGEELGGDQAPLAAQG
jgi:hypothetical protein